VSPTLRKWDMNPTQIIRDWLQQTMADKELSVYGWADRAGVSKSTIFRALKDDVDNLLSTRTLARLALAAGVRPPDIVPDDTDPTPGAPKRNRIRPVELDTEDMPIRYEVAAGAWRERNDFADQPFGYFKVAPIEPYPMHAQWLERVVGPSYNRVLSEGALVHVVDAIEIGYEPRHGDVVVVCRRRAQGAFEERSLKEVRFAQGHIELWPNSFDARFQEPLKLLEDDENLEDVEVLIAARVLRAYVEF
jgi:hypothetical protein